MTIEQIDSGKVLIVLGRNDMEDFSLEYETMSFTDPHSKKVLARLLTLACVKTGICIKGKKMLVEALPHPEGCLILMTLRAERERKYYRIKRGSRNLCCVIDSAEELMNLCSALCRLKGVPDSSVYFYDDRYYLVAESVLVSPFIMRVFGEFSSRVAVDNILAAKVGERGKLIAHGNAHLEIGKFWV